MHMTTLYDFQVKSEQILMEFYNARASGTPLDITEDELRDQIKKLRLEFILSTTEKKQHTNYRTQKVTDDIVSALMNMGRDKTEAARAVYFVSREVTEFDEVFKLANRWFLK